MTDLPLFASLKADQSAAARLEPLMWRYLEDGHWHTRRELERLLQTNERVIREIGERSKGQIIGTDKGYKLIRYATVQECEESEGRMLSQIKRMAQKVRDQRKARNRGGVAA